MKDLIAAAKAKPGALTYASAGIAGSSHVLGAFFNIAAGIDTVHVPYKGGGPGMLDLRAGRVSYMITSMVSSLNFARDGRARLLAVTGTKRSHLFPDVPTLGESGFPGFESVLWHGLLAPAKVPRQVVTRINREIVKVLAMPDVQKPLQFEGGVVSPSTPEEFAAFLRADRPMDEDGQADRHYTGLALAFMDSPYRRRGELRDRRTAQAYPSRPIRIVTSQPGGGGDFISRVVGQAISPALAQPVIIDNRGGGVLPAIYVSTATADGYTLVGSSGVLWTGPFMQKVAYDPVRDFAPISLAVSAPNVLVVHPALRAHSVKDLIALAKAKPGQLNYASAGAGGSAHLSGALFKSMARIDIVLIPYKGAGPALNALFSGEVQMIFATTTAATAHLQSGRLRALAVTTAKPSALVPACQQWQPRGSPATNRRRSRVFLPRRERLMRSFDGFIGRSCAFWTPKK